MVHFTFESAHTLMDRIGCIKISGSGGRRQCAAMRDEVSYFLDTRDACDVRNRGFTGNTDFSVRHWQQHTMCGSFGNTLNM